MFSLLVVLINGRSLVTGASITVVNKCEETVWPGIRKTSPIGSSGGNPGLGSIGFELPRDSSRSFQAPTGWSGQIWGRTGCNFKDTNNGSCTTGDCGSGQLQCNDAGAIKPATLAEFTLQYPLQPGRSLDYYDVSLANGFNLPMLVEATGLCVSTGCTIDLNKICPMELRAKSGVACQSPCQVFKKPEYCCTGE